MECVVVYAYSVQTYVFGVYVVHDVLVAFDGYVSERCLLISGSESPWIECHIEDVSLFFSDGIRT